eukprot:6967186-Prymnesium_polylepis.1
MTRSLSPPPPARSHQTSPSSNPSASICSISTKYTGTHPPRSLPQWPPPTTQSLPPPSESQ